LFSRAGRDGERAAGDGHVGVCIDAAAISGRLAARGGDGSAGDGHAVCIDAVASPRVMCRLAARGGDGSTGDGHVGVCIDAAAISGRLAARGGDGAAGDGHAVCIDATAILRLAARGGDGSTGDGDISSVCIDATAILRLAGRDGERAASLNRNVSVGSNADAIAYEAMHVGDGVFRAVRQDDGRAIEQPHRGWGGGGKVHALEGEGACGRIPFAVSRTLRFRGVEQRQRRFCVSGEVRRLCCRCRSLRQRGGGQQTQAQHQGKQYAESPPQDLIVFHVSSSVSVMNVPAPSCRAARRG